MDPKRFEYTCDSMGGEIVDKDTCKMKDENGENVILLNNADRSGSGSVVVRYPQK